MTLFDTLPTDAETMVTVHKWQDQGLGVAPFDAVAILTIPDAGESGMNVDGYQAALRDVFGSARGYGVSLGSCQSCGMCLRNNVVIRDANRKYFVVGCDCAEKTDDTRVMTQTEKLERDRQQAKREAKRQQERAEREARIAADLEAQRQRNGGRTDAEIEADRVKAEGEANRAKWTAVNGWIIDVLSRNTNSEFCQSIARELETAPSFPKLRGRVYDIVRDIYGKETGGRSGSKKWKEAVARFDERFETENGITHAE